MILEIADIRITAGSNSAFEAAIDQAARQVLSKASGFRHYQIHHSIESPQRYVLQVGWDTVEDHTVGFRQSPAFAQWRALIGPFFAEPPMVEHFNLLGASGQARA